MTNLFKKIRKILKRKTLKYLRELLKKHEEWFEYSYDIEAEEERRKLKTKNQIIEWILDSDPIFADGGLMDFLSENLFVLEYMEICND